MKTPPRLPVRLGLLTAALTEVAVVLGRERWLVISALRIPPECGNPPESGEPPAGADRAPRRE